MSSGTPTAVLGLHTFEDVDSILADEVNENSQTTDLLPYTVCTSGTRPSSNLFAGRMIYETDTKRVYSYINGSWLLISSVPIMTKRTRTNTLAVADGAVVNFDNFQTLNDSFNSADLAHAAGVVTISRPGFYAMSITAEWAAVTQNGTGVGRRRLAFKVNGVAAYEGPSDDMPASGQSLNSAFRQTTSAELLLNTADTVQPFAFNSLGSAASILAGAMFTIYRVY